MNFTPLDTVILLAYLLGCLTLGTLAGRGRHTLDDYFLGSKKMPWWAISLSIVATETSTLTFIGAPAIAYTGNLTFLQIVAGYFIGRLLVSFVLLPSYFKGSIYTAYELLNFQFGKKVQNFSAILFQGSRSLSDGVRLFATGLVLSVVTGLSDHWTVIIIGGLTIAYTYYGGMRAVVWNDVAQLIVYTAGAGIAFLVLLGKIPGGWAEVVAVSAPLGKLDLLDFTLSLSQAYTFWAGLVGGTFITFATHGTDQMMVQRYLACGDRKGSQLALVLSGIVVFFQFLIFLVIGVMLYVFYQHVPLERELIQVDRIFPIFIVEQMPAGLSGLIIAGIFASAMSTLSSSLNSLSSSSINDFYKVYFAKGASDAHYFRASRRMTLFWGAALIVISLLARNFGSVLEAGLTIASITMGSVLGIFLLGLQKGKINESGALVSMGTGLVIVLAMHLLSNVAWTWYMLVGTVGTFFVGILWKTLTRQVTKRT
ncbi:MAG: sodium:solute symporter [Acidobacteriota bacterium]|nr:sodium:solute symporter [Acidobacteriota bacterium]